MKLRLDEHHEFLGRFGLTPQSFAIGDWNLELDVERFDPEKCWVMLDVETSR